MLYFQFVDYFFFIALILVARFSYKRFYYFLHMAQLNGYKSNEFWVWIKDNWAKQVAIPEFYFIYFVLVAQILGYKYLTLSTHSIILSSVLIFWFGSTKRYKVKQKKPLVFTPRMVRQTIVSVILGLPLAIWGFKVSYQVNSMIFHPIFASFGFVFSCFSAPFAVLIAGFITKPIENSIQNGFKKKASDKVNALPTLKVIGITGSYGKTSTKFMLRDLLQERFNVLATPGSFNTPMGICKVINEDLVPTHQLLILEMGARYKGNIKELCEIAKPHLAIVSNVGKAHLETFGSQEAIAQTKSELVENMQPNGVVFLNANDPLVMKMAEKTSSKVISAGIEAGDYQASNISYGAEGCSFLVTTPQGESAQISMSLLGAHNVQNLVLAIALAHHEGLRLETIALAAKKIQPIEHRLELKNRNGILIIDDAFNSNPVGAKNAVEILAQFASGKRIIITPGMVELGEKEDEENKILGNHIGKANLDKVIFVGLKRSKPMVDGYLEAGGDTEKMNVVATLFEANALVYPTLQTGDVVLYENDLPDSYNE